MDGWTQKGYKIPKLMFKALKNKYTRNDLKLFKFVYHTKTIKSLFKVIIVGHFMFKTPKKNCIDIAYRT